MRFVSASVVSAILVTAGCGGGAPVGEPGTPQPGRVIHINGAGATFPYPVYSQWFAEYNAPILAIRIVDSLDAAIEHINHYGSQHTDSIITENFSDARRFLTEVDSASVMVNASTRFADGFEYGLGAEIGISTDKLHARGPVGLEGLTSEKYVVFGDGHIRT